jgi:hypothetical protein
MQGHCVERFSRAGGRIEDDVFPVEQFENRGFLRGIKLQPPALHEFEKPPEQSSAIERTVGGDEMEK